MSENNFTTWLALADEFDIDYRTLQAHCEPIMPQLIALKARRGKRLGLLNPKQADLIRNFYKDTKENDNQNEQE